MEHKLPQGYYREEHKQEGEYNNKILTNGGFSNQRESIDGSLNYEGIPTDGCSQLYVGDMDIKFENVAAIQNSHSMNTKTL